MARTYTGFGTDAKGGEKRLTCDLEAVDDPAVLDDAGLLVDRGDDPDTTAVEMDRLEAAVPVTNDK